MSSLGFSVLGLQLPFISATHLKKASDKIIAFVEASDSLVKRHFEVLCPWFSGPSNLMNIQSYDQCLCTQGACKNFDFDQVWSNGPRRNNDVATPDCNSVLRRSPLRSDTAQVEGSRILSLEGRVAF
jgi:hypothetical protein